MPVTYTNRKGRTYYLCRTETKSGSPWYFFAREPKGEPVDEVPEGWEIRESVNGIVSLAKVRPAQILPLERELVETLVRRHPKAHNYRVDVKGDAIVVYERAGPDPDEVLSGLRGLLGALGERGADALRETLDEGARFSPEMRFMLHDEGQRTFQTERWCYLGSIDDWIEIGPRGPLSVLVKRFIPLLGTDRLYDVHF
jgi:hypothetical protein